MAVAVVAAVTAAIAPLYPDPRCLRVCLYLFTPSPLVPSPPCLPPPPQLRHRQTIPPFPRAPFSPARLSDSPELPLPATFFVRIRLVHRDKAASKPFYQSTEKIREDPSAAAPRASLLTNPRALDYLVCTLIYISRFDQVPAEFIFVHSTWRVSLITFKGSLKVKARESDQ